MIDLAKLVDHQDNLGPMKALLAAWQDVRADGNLPDYEALMLRDDVLPLLRDVMVVGRDGGGPALYRFVGSGVVERVGYDLTGHAVTDYMPEDGRDIYLWTFNAICGTPVGHYARVRNQFKSGYEAINEMLTLPVKGAPGDGLRLVFSIACINELRKIHEMQDDLMINVEWTSMEFIDLGHGVPDWGALAD